MKFLQDLWDEAQARQWESDPLELLRYRSNLLGADLRITNFGGGNTSSKFELPDPFTRKPVPVLAVKGSGGDLGSITRGGFAVLYMERLEQLRSIYRGVANEDEMVSYYPLSAFGENRVAASIDTPLHAFLPYAHVDHLHPDWAIAVAASANGKTKLEEFNQRFGRRLVWLPWQRPGFELGLMLRRAVQENPKCDGIVLGGHGLFTWGRSQHECYTNSLTVIDQLGEFVQEHQDRIGDGLFGGAHFQPHREAADVATSILPYLRGKLATMRRSIAHYSSSAEVMQFVNSHDAEALARLGTSCPDHFIRTRIRPLYVCWNPGVEDFDRLKEQIAAQAENYRKEYIVYYHSLAQRDSPALRDPNAAVVLIPGLGMFTFGKDKKEARIIGEFYLNAIQVMAGATALGEGKSHQGLLPQAPSREDSVHFTSFKNYVALPMREAFKIEYWSLEEAKLKRMPPEKEFSRQIFLIVGGGSGIGRVTAARLAERGAHIMISDKDGKAATEAEVEIAGMTSKEAVASCELDLANRQSIAQALKATVARFGGLDGVINTAAVFLAPDTSGHLSDEQWKFTLDINITGNYLLADEVRKVLLAQGIPAVMIFTSSANAVVPKRGSEAYDVSKTAVSHLIRELAVGLAPLVRVNGISPATVIEGSAMFPRDRVVASLTKYNIPHQENESTEELRTKLAEFYSQRTLTRRSVTPDDCAEAICWLASERSAKTTGHLIPVDGGLVEAFLR